MHPEYCSAQDEDATGGIPLTWEDTIVPFSPSKVSGDDAEKPASTIIRYFNQDPFTVASVLSTMASDTLSNYFVRKATETTDATIINLVVRKATPIFRPFVLDRFEKLATEWRNARNHTNSGTEMFMHPAYQKIIGMGSEAIPLILKDMEVNLDHWFWALKSITGEDPVPPAHRGRLKLMTKDWLDWAKVQGYEW